MPPVTGLARLETLGGPMSTQVIVVIVVVILILILTGYIVI